MQTTTKPKCPESRPSWYDHTPLCNLNSKICLLEGDNECPVYEEYLKEIEPE